MRNIVFTPVLTIFLLSGCVSTNGDVAGKPQTNVDQQSNSTLVEFRGVVFGEKPPADVAFKLLDGSSAANRNKIYTRIDDELRIGDVKVESIGYSFFDEKLYGVSIEIGDKFCADFRAVKNSIELKYKTKLIPAFPDQDDMKYHFGRSENVQIVISCDDFLSETKTAKTTVLFSHAEIHPQVIKYQKEIMDRSANEKATKK